MTRNELMEKIMAADFALTDTGLFLDTHPRDAKALEYYHMTAEKVKELTAIYEQTFGPITAQNVCRKNAWNWIDQPWPWETGE